MSPPLPLAAQVDEPGLSGWVSDEDIFLKNAGYGNKTFNMLPSRWESGWVLCGKNLN